MKGKAILQRERKNWQINAIWNGKRENTERNKHRKTERQRNHIERKK